MSHHSARICAVITEARTEDARAVLAAGTPHADLFELRLDYLRDFDFSQPENLRPLLAGKSLPVIITCRATHEGGVQHVDDTVRLPLLVEGARRWADYCDIEAAHYQLAARLSPDPSRLILSHHDLQKTPADLTHVYERICEMPAAVYKIVTQANSVADSLAIFDLLRRARGEGRKLIALGMGEPGKVTRILGPSFGGFLSYGSLGRGRESATGQLTCEELDRSYRLRQLSPETTVMAIIGRPVAQSASPAMHNAAFASLGLDCVYVPIEVDDVEQFFARFVRAGTREIDWNLRGFSVTVPHKTALVRLLDSLDATAQRIGAVNTVVIEESGRLVGYNTDARGAIEPLERRCSLDGEHCAVIGAGGAARAVVYGLLERGARVTVFARDLVKAGALADAFGVPIAPLDSLEPSNARVLINTTPIGMYGHSEGQTVVPRSTFRGRRIAFDLVYNPIETRFLSEGRGEGCQTISGLEMLVHQAAIQFELWTGHKPPLDIMRAAALAKAANDSAR